MRGFFPFDLAQGQNDNRFFGDDSPFLSR